MITRLRHLLLILLFLLLPSQLALHFWPSWSLVNGIRVDYLSPTLYFTDIIIFGLFLLSPPVSTGVRGGVIYRLSIFIFIVLNLLISYSPLVSLYRWFRLLEYFWLYKYLTRLHSPLSTFHSPLSTFHSPLSLSLLWTSALAWWQFFKQASVGGWWYWLGERSFDIMTPGIAKIPPVSINWLTGQLATDQLLRPYATLPHPNALAGYLLVGGLIVYYLNKSQTKLSIAHWALSIAAITLPLTFSRTAIFLELLVLAIYISTKIKYISVKITFLVASTLLLFYSSTLLPGNPLSLPERLSLNRSAIGLIKSFPLFGVGLGNFIPASSTLLSPLSTFQPVHNIYLLLASELGLPAVLIIGYLVIENWLKIVNFKLKIPLLVILFTGAADHYWLTLHQNTLLLVLLLAMVRLSHESIPASGQKYRFPNSG